jgi:2-octaprenyl-6-methoxyphenol hydroxylase
MPFQKQCQTLKTSCGNELYDIAIVGAGLVGASLALALKATGLRIALIDAHVQKTEDKRLFALNDSSVRLLAQLGVWPLIESKATPIKQIQVSRRKRFGVVKLESDEVNLPALGQMMPARLLEAAQQTLLEEMSTLSIYRPMQLTHLVEEEQAVVLQLQSNEGAKTLRARYVMGVDGTKSSVRSLMRWDTTEEDSKQIAIVAEIGLSVNHQCIAYERFYEEGVLAMLPLPDNTVAMILTVPENDAANLLGMKDDEFLAHVQTLFGNRLGKLQHISARASYPLSFVLAKEAASKRVLLLGNAAHTLHPVAAQGFNLALYEVAVFLAITSQTVSQPEWDCRDILRKCQHQQRLSIRASRGLVSLLHEPSCFKELVLHGGMFLFAALPVVRRKFLQVMLGRIGARPSLLLES